MTIDLFKTQDDAKKQCRKVKSYFKPRKISCVIVKVRYDKKDGPQFGMRGSDFAAKHGRQYYICAQSKKDAKKWGFSSKILT